MQLTLNCYKFEFSETSYTNKNISYCQWQRCNPLNVLLKLFSLLWFAVDFFARGLHTRTAVARLPWRHLGFLVFIYLFYLWRIRAGTDVACTEMTWCRNVMSQNCLDTVNADMVGLCFLYIVFEDRMEMWKTECCMMTEQRRWYKESNILAVVEMRHASKIMTLETTLYAE